jgi:hypothetical protein
MGGIKDDSVWRGNKAIMHIDMDAFFAAVEQEINPDLNGFHLLV